jgi:hypothetical protein
MGGAPVGTIETLLIVAVLWGLMVVEHTRPAEDI